MPGICLLWAARVLGEERFAAKRGYGMRSVRRVAGAGRKLAGVGLMLTLSFAGPSFAGFQAVADTFPRQPGVKILHYTFDVTLDDNSSEVVVKDTIDLQFMAAGVRGLDLNLCSLVKEPQT